MVGYVEKRIRLRKTQFQLMQKMAEKKKTAAATLEAEVEHTPRQTVSKLRPWFKQLLSLQSGTNWCLCSQITLRFQWPCVSNDAFNDQSSSSIRRCVS